MLATGVTSSFWHVTTWEQLDGDFILKQLKQRLFPSAGNPTNVVWIIDLHWLSKRVILCGELEFFKKYYRDIHILSHCKSFHHSTRSTWLWRQQANFFSCSHCIATRGWTDITIGTTQFNEIVWFDKIFEFLRNETQTIVLRWSHHFWLATWPENNIIQEIHPLFNRTYLKKRVMLMQIGRIEFYFFNLRNN